MRCSKNEKTNITGTQSLYFFAKLAACTSSNPRPLQQQACISTKENFSVWQQSGPITFAGEFQLLRLRGLSPSMFALSPSHNSLPNCGSLCSEESPWQALHSKLPPAGHHRALWSGIAGLPCSSRLLKQHQGQKVTRSLLLHLLLLLFLLNPLKGTFKCELCNHVLAKEQPQRQLQPVQRVGWAGTPNSPDFCSRALTDLATRWLVPLLTA